MHMYVHMQVSVCVCLYIYIWYIRHQVKFIYIRGGDISDKYTQSS